MAHKGLREPHVLLLGNPQKAMRNLSAVLTEKQLAKIQAAVNQEIKLLFDLGCGHCSFAQTVDSRHWRQKISRLYYGAYNVKRSVTLCCDGTFSTESSDHNKIDQLPDGFGNAATYAAKLRALREDRNLADYSHLARESDLVVPVALASVLVEEFIDDARQYLNSKGLQL